MNKGKKKNRESIWYIRWQSSLWNEHTNDLRRIHRNICDASTNQITAVPTKPVFAFDFRTLCPFCRWRSSVVSHHSTLNAFIAARWSLVHSRHLYSVHTHAHMPAHTSTFLHSVRRVECRYTAAQICRLLHVVNSQTSIVFSFVFHWVTVGIERSVR